ncbi:hypothetical protein LX77_01962 [Gelidibacter algens]|uniref:Secreted protein n=1 Tax=Gelidibacter algens TaxID=49280 RepID=A0A1A7QZX0_9FLAO|nr:hypothetical protein [Gelidibacter algens]OBX24828.1 hypothetical protein A9996_13110 [Gelidibacter algens]RAJ24410.1 hypothetical protein LX77_01962 [Gelidibacter algens]
MKKLIFICAVMLSLASCNTDDSNEFYNEILPIESVDIPEEFILGEIYPITVTYIRPAGCYVFYDFYYTRNLNQRTVAVMNTFFPNENCGLAEEGEAQATFNFKVTSNGTYIFKFWQGKDDSGTDLYYIVEVPVVE